MLQGGSGPQAVVLEENDGLKSLVAHQVAVAKLQRGQDELDLFDRLLAEKRIVLGRFDDHFVRTAASHRREVMRILGVGRILLDSQGRKLVRKHAHLPVRCTRLLGRSHGIDFRRREGFVARTKRTARATRLDGCSLTGLLAHVLRPQGARRRKHDPIVGGHVESQLRHDAQLSVGRTVFVLIRRATSRRASTPRAACTFDRQHQARRLAQHRFGDTAQQDAAQPASAMRAEHDQIALRFVGGAQECPRRPSPLPIDTPSAIGCGGLSSCKSRSRYSRVVRGLGRHELSDGNRRLVNVQQHQPRLVVVRQRAGHFKGVMRQRREIRGVQNRANSSMSKLR